MAETEKITINMSVVDLGKIDLLVEEGFYQNRTDFIRTAIRIKLEQHEPAVQSSVVRNAFGMGVFGYSRKELEDTLAKGDRKRINVIGMLILHNDVTPEIADKAIESIQVHGVFKAPAGVKDVLKDRMR